MKTIANKLWILLALPLALWSCKEGVQEYKDTDLARVTELIAPAGNETIYLHNNDEVLTFEWKTVKEGVIKYEVAFFASQTGAEIYRFVPEDGAITGVIDISHKLLDEISALAGIGTAEAGDLYWTVYTKRGMTAAQADVAVKKLPLKRFAGFADLPAKLYIWGEATEGGTNITQAQQFRNDEDKIFDI